MRLLFTIDSKDYNPGGTSFSRPSVRGILIDGNGKIGMVHSLKFGYYKFPGGGIEPGETHQEALIREYLEETGLTLIPGSIREYGYVHRVEKGKQEDMFIQDSFYYFCEAEPGITGQKLDDYEAEEQFTFEFIQPRAAIAANRQMKPDSVKQGRMVQRDTRVLELLI